MRDGESVNDEALDEADLVIECLARGDLGPTRTGHSWDGANQGETR